MSEDHTLGFEKETQFNNFFSTLFQFDQLKFSALKEAISTLAPNFSANLFERKECRRKLKYVGNTWSPQFENDDDEYFKIGHTYWSTSFNGATYTIEGHYEVSSKVERPIGYSYFEWVT